MNKAQLIAISTSTLLLVSCDLRPQSAYGFRLPDGDSANGQIVYVEKACASCHAIKGKEEFREGFTPEMTVEIGGMQTRLSTYGELVTSVINPSHQIARKYRSEEFAVDGKSRMTNYNDVLTVTELIDLVAFLQDQYSEFPDY